ncbi:MAG: helix-hairpin-helix domain-containing protein [Nanoarchaeota archaeon]|nr:helix-hairpin-helix domain-containing protein [Nanoarchaeota archaeon]
MKILGLIFIAFITLAFLGGSVIALCESDQININTASASELEELYGVGPAKSQAIVNYRETKSFETLDDLINVNGIGEVTLSNIKNQGLACIGEDGETTEDIEPEKTDKEVKEVENPNIDEKVQESKEKVLEPLTFETIALNNPKDIKSDENSEKTGESYALYGFIAFSILIVSLLVMKNVREKRYKNEFM